MRYVMGLRDGTTPFVIRLTAAVVLLAGGGLAVPTVQAASVDTTMMTVVVDIGETLAYLEVPAYRVADVIAAADGEVVAVSRPARATIAATWPSDDAESSLQWAIPAAGFDALPDRAGGNGIVVAVIDTGVFANHEDLTSSVADGGDYVDTVSQTLTDPHGHGTHVAGIIAAHRDNNLGIAGGAPGATVVAYRVLDTNGSGSTADIAEAITAAVDAGADIINLSLTAGFDPAVDAAVADAVQRGTLIVAASGNNAETTNAPGWPSEDPNTIAVGAVREDLQRAPESTTGTQVDLAAPGDQILSTYKGSPSAYAWGSGTSQATAYVSAAAAAIWSAHPQATAAQIRAALETTAVDLGAPGVDTSFGAGLIDADAALDALDNIFGSGPPSSDFTAVAPLRVFDTRADGTGWRSVPRSKVGGDNILEVQFSDLAGRIPATGVDAVSLNVTVTNPAAAGFVTVYPCGDRKLVSSVNYPPGGTVANAVITKVSPSGTVCFFSSAPTDLIVDVNGWFPNQSGYHPVDPLRVFDTRPDGTGWRDVPRRQVGGAYILEVQLDDLGATVPATGVGAVSINVTVTNPAAAGFVTVYPCGERRVVSSVNYLLGGTVANAVITPLSPTGTICVFSSAPADLIVDVNGWFAATGTSYTAIDPQRVFDTRPGTGGLRNVPKAQVGGANILTVQVTDLVGFVPASGVGAVSLNVVATEPVGDGFVTVYPCQGSPPVVSSLNYLINGTVANAVIAPVSPKGTICLYSPVATHLVADINGWFATAG